MTRSIRLQDLIYRRIMTRHYFCPATTLLWQSGYCVSFTTRKIGVDPKFDPWQELSILFALFALAFHVVRLFLRRVRSINVKVAL